MKLRRQSIVRIIRMEYLQTGFLHSPENDKVTKYQNNGMKEGRGYFEPRPSRKPGTQNPEPGTRNLVITQIILVRQNPRLK